MDSPGTNTGMGIHSLLQGIFLTKGLNLGLLHCRQILYHLSHWGSPMCRYSVQLSFGRNLFQILLDCSSLDRWLVKSTAQLSSWHLFSASSSMCVFFSSSSFPYVESPFSWNTHRYLSWFISSFLVCIFGIPHSQCLLRRGCGNQNKGLRHCGLDNMLILPPHLEDC